MFKLNSIMLVITSSLAINAIAAEETVIEKEKTEKIFIVGSKQELTLQEVDASVELFSEERLDAERIVDLTDVLLRVPNVASNGASNNITIRGIGRTGSTGSGQGVTSNIYIDGSPLSGTALNRGVTSLWDTQQIEVLRGSQSSIQGRNALAGAIVVTTTDPTYEQSGKFRLSYAENNTSQIAGAYGNSIIDNQLAFRVAADLQQTDGFIDSVFFDDNTDKEERLLLRAKVLFEPEAIDGLTMKLTVDHNDIKVGNGSLAVRSSFEVTDSEYETFSPFDFIDSGTNPRNETETTRVILDTHYALSDNWSVKNIITHEETEVNRLFGSIEKFDEIGEYTSNTFDETITSAEIRLTFDYDNISGVIGGYYFDAKDDQSRHNEAILNPQVALATSGFGFVTPADTAAIVLDDDSTTNTKNTAFFAQVRIDLDEAFTLDLGIRYDDEQFDNTGSVNVERSVSPEECIATVPGSAIDSRLPAFPLQSIPCALLVDAVLGAPSDDQPQTAKYNAWLPKATLTYNLDQDHSFFVSAQRGYRAGGSYFTRIANPNGGGNVQAIDTYEPEYLNTLEIGSRSTFADGDIVFNTNIFQSKYKDQQVSLPGEDLANFRDDVIVNAAESTISGIELSFEYIISQTFDVYASLAFLDAEYDDFPFADQGEFSNLAGNELPDSASVSASISANWKSDDGLFANVSAYYTSSRFSDTENLDNSDIYPVAVSPTNNVSENIAKSLTEEVESYVNVNLRFGYEMDDITFYGFVTNVFDEEVITSLDIAGVDQASGEVSLSTGGTNSRFLAPRTFGVGIDYSF
jgi:outer membrane receptor protein involved in Fe transport